MKIKPTVFKSENDYDIWVCFNNNDDEYEYVLGMPREEAREKEYINLMNEIFISNKVSKFYHSRFSNDAYAIILNNEKETSKVIARELWRELVRLGFKRVV